MDELRAECAAGDELACSIWRGAEGAVSKDLAGKRVAVIGSGPASLTCAGELAKRGCDVTVFEALHKVGGVLTYGIPEFRLPKDLVAREVSKLGDNGVSFEVNALVGKLYDIDELMDDRGFDAVFVGTGAGLPSYLGIEGEGLNGVMVASELLTRVNLMKAYLFPEYETPVYAGKKCVVVGGGNVAMDAARTAKRLGADVTVVYRRGRDEMPARAEEVHHAEQEGIEFRLLTNPVRILGDENGWVTRRGMRAHGAGRARRQRAPPSRGGGRQRVRHRHRHAGGGGGFQDEPAYREDHPGAGGDAAQPDRGRRAHLRHVEAGRVRRRRRGHRRGYRHPGHGRGQTCRRRNRRIPDGGVACTMDR